VHGARVGGDQLESSCGAGAGQGGSAGRGAGIADDRLGCGGQGRCSPTCGDQPRRCTTRRAGARVMPGPCSAAVVGLVAGLGGAEGWRFWAVWALRAAEPGESGLECSF